MKKEKKDYRTTLYLDQKTNERLQILSKEMKRSKNNTITFILNYYFEYKCKEEIKT